MQNNTNMNKKCKNFLRLITVIAPVIFTLSDVSKKIT